MRIRKKKHLEERLKLVSDYVIVPDRDIPNVTEAVKNKNYFNFQEIFGNNNPVELEIGCGKGGFIVQKAKENPNVNYIAVELLCNIIVMAAELAKKEKITNVKFVNSGAEYLPRYIKPNSINKIYLNFSPPFPPLTYETRRLTCDRFVVAYKDYLVSGGKIIQKTDDKDFFNYSLGKFIQHGFETQDISFLLNSNQIENTETEYEKKFKSIGIDICGRIATKV